MYKRILKTTDEDEKKAVSAKLGIGSTQNFHLQQWLEATDVMDRFKTVVKLSLEKVVSWAVGYRFQGHQKTNTDIYLCEDAATITSEHIL